MENIEIIDDFLPKNIQDIIEELCLTTQTTYTYNSATLSDNVHSKNFKDAEQFVNLFIEKGEFVKDDFSIYFMLPILIGSINKGIDIKLKNILRAKTNMTLKQYNVPENFVNPPHIDQSLAVGVNLAAIYYVNDSDGDTILYEGNILQELEPIKRITPKKGRLLIMDGDRFHSSSHPTKTDRRLVINYNIKF
jgi:hypothetical protein